MALFSLSLTLGFYIFVAYINQKTQKTWINPLLFSSIMIIFVLKTFNIEYETYHEGVQFITLLLGPATVALAIPLYENKKTILKYSKQIFISIISGTVAHALSLIVLKSFLNLSSELFITSIPKSVTTAIAKDISFQNGGMVEITVALVIITGIFGAVISDFVFKKCNIKSNVSKGLSLGVSAHAVGTSKAVEMGAVEASMSTIALILTGILTVIVTPLIILIF